jgi:hypothetical protein
MKSTIPLILCEHSSNIIGYGYDAATSTLAIRFKAGPGGNIYHYTNVPPALYEQLCGAKSKGKFFAAFIKDDPLYPATLMKPEEDDDDGDEPVPAPTSPTEPPQHPAKVEEPQKEAA